MTINHPVHSATVASLARARQRRDSSARLLDSAHAYVALSSTALEEGFVGDAFESAYRAALRCAGVKVARSPVAQRARLPRSVWEQLKLVDEPGRIRAAEFAQYSRLRSRVLSGIEAEPAPSTVEELLSLVESFMQEVDVLDSPQLSAA